MDQRSQILARNIALIKHGRTATYSRSLAHDRTLQRLITDLVNARATAGLSQEDVALRMSTTKSAVSRLESGSRTRPTLRTIQRYAFAVGARLEISVRIPA
jgi:ribosome-binding protein aMBF1 (putative translation factor)